MTNVFRLFTLTTFFLAYIGLSAQFVTPVTTISGDAEVTTTQNKVITGAIKTASFGPNGVMSFKIKNAAGTSVKLKAADVSQLKLKVNGLAKMEIIAEQSSNINKLAKSNFKEVVDREYIYWQQLKHPEKEKYMLLQLLNPGFDDLIKVYEIPNSKSGELSMGDVAISGNEATAYYVVKDNKTIKITKKKYKKQDFQHLFSDCPAIIEANEPNFKYFSEHVFFYNERCKK